MSDASNSAFPSDRSEALAMLYLQNQDLKGKTPEEIQTMYFEAYYAILRDHRSKRAAGWFKDLKEAE